MYKVKLSISKCGFQKEFLDGVYISASNKVRVSDMKADCIHRMKLQLINANPDFEGVDIEVIAFKKIKTQFVCNAAAND